MPRKAKKIDNSKIETGQNDAADEKAGIGSSTAATTKSAQLPTAMQQPFLKQVIYRLI